MKPERHLGEFDRHRVLVDPVDDALQHHAANDLAIVELPRRDRPAVPPCLVQDAGTDRGDALRQGRCVGGEAHGSRRVRHGFEYAVGQPVDEAHQKVAGAHGGVADLQVEQPARRVDRGELGEPDILGSPVSFHGSCPLLEGSQALFYDRADRTLDNQGDELVGRVVAARVAPSSRVFGHGD